MLIQQLYNTIISSPLTLKIIQLIPEGDEIIVAEDKGRLEIGFSKRTYLKLFKEVHTIWHEVLKCNSELLEETSLENLWQVYYMTLGFLITTNENHTIITLHEKVVFRLYRILGDEFLRREIDIISTFLTSRLKRINKSSSLWFLMKKLTIVIVSKEWDILESVIVRALSSCELHFANYYGITYMRWCVNMGFIGTETTNPSRSKLAEEIKILSHRHLKDASLWNLQATFLLRQGGFEDSCLKFAVEEYNTLAETLNQLSSGAIHPKQISDPLKIQSSTTETLQEIRDQFEWLITVQCPTATPYLTLIGVSIILLGPTSLLSELAQKSKETVGEKLHTLDESSASYLQSLAYSDTLDRVVRHMQTLEK